MRQLHESQLVHVLLKNVELIFVVPTNIIHYRLVKWRLQDNQKYALPFDLQDISNNTNAPVFLEILIFVFMIISCKQSLALKL